MLAETVDGRTVRSGFDAAGRRTSRHTAAGVLSTWDYDAVGNPVALHTGDSVMTFAHDQLGRQIGRTSGEVTMAQAWTRAGRLTARTVTAHQPISHQTWHYRPDGYLDGTNDQQFSLDPQGRVTAVHQQGWSERYDYDAVGNITNAAPPDGAAGPREYTATRLRSAGRTSYVHDHQGRVVQRRHRTLSGQVRLWQYTWDAEDRLTGVVTPEGSTWRYRYDPFGRRVAKQRLAEDGTVLESVAFTWDGTRLAEHTHSAGGTTNMGVPTRYRRPGRPARPEHVQDTIDEKFYAIVADIVGAPTELVDTTGVVAWQRTSTLWGQSLTQSGPAVCPLRFPGQYHDAETGWDYNGKQILDKNYQPVMFPEEVYINNNNDLVVFQDHYTGHSFGEGGVGDQPPHVHVRPYDDPRGGQIPGAQEHYYYDPNLGRPAFAG